MAVYKCKMCGGDLSITADMNIVECEYCGTTQTVPTADNEKKVNLFNRANRLRINSEFDKAASIYENIIAEFPEEAEAYWGLCLCNYGIEYVDDPATAKKVPTCHRASFEKLVSDENFELAMEYADVAAQKVYRDEAREIDRIMNDILSISRNEKPYDVFICYKETDEKGERTIDSVLAQDVYDALTAKGMKVFFSRISLEDKLGQMYEPYIFAALNSAKVLLCVGTKYEHFHAVWVKNEWSRFLKLMAKDKTKVLIPCYKDMDAYDLPDEFRALQAQDMGKIGFMQDLVRGVSKIFSSTEQSTPKQTVTQDATPQTNSNIKQLMINGDTMYTGEVFADVPHGNGRAEYKNGDVYEGEWNRGKRNGTGKISWAKGGEFVGEWYEDRIISGNGVVYTVKDNFSFRYEGEYRDGERNGFGKYAFTDSVYEGQWVNGKRHGQGKTVWNEGGEFVGEYRDDNRWNGNGVVYTVKDGFRFRYEGEYRNGERNGFGKFAFTDSVYEGQWVNGKRHGQGKTVWNEGGVFVGEYRDNSIWNGNGVVYTVKNNFRLRYEGEYKNGKRNGFGKIIYEDSVYEGQWKDNVEHGQGKLLWNNGNTFVGEFSGGEPWNGTGKFVYNDSVYEGGWKNGKEHGQGKLTWNSGGEIAGEFLNGEIWNGKGVCRYTNGCYYDGEIRNGLQNGYGRYKYEDSVYEGQWINGQENGKGKLSWNDGGEFSGEFRDGEPWNGSGIYYFGQERYEGEIKNGKRASRFFGFKRF